MNELWQAALAERGEKAFELFKETPSNKGAFGHPAMCNHAIEIALTYGDEIELNPIDTLIELDVDRYGEKTRGFCMNQNLAANGLQFLQI